MKKNLIFGALTAAALLAVGACSNDMIDSNGSLKPDQLVTDNGSGGVYMTVDFKLPAGVGGTRSETINGGGSSDGEEVGTEAESNVTSALVVLAFDKAASENLNDTLKVDNYGYIVSGEIKSGHIDALPAKDNSKFYKAAAQLSKANLNDFYSLFFNPVDSTYKVPQVYVFVFCNPTNELRDYFAGQVQDNDSVSFGRANWINKTCKVLQRNGSNSDLNVGIWGSNSFLMNNKSLTKRALPQNLLDWDYFNDYDKAFHLSGKNTYTVGVEEKVVDNSDDVEGRGAIQVERSVARFDFKDGSNKDNSYNVLEAREVNDTTKKASVVGVQLEKMCLVNMGNKFYYLPRVSEDGQLDGPDYSLCGREKPWIRGAGGRYTGGNYVVGPYASVFKGAKREFGYQDSELGSGSDQGLGNEKDFKLDGVPLSDYFNFPFFDNHGLYNTDLDLGSKWDVVKISDILKNGNQDANKQYRVWRYVTENVIPTIEDQVNGISTGVIFKAKMIPGINEGTIDWNNYDEYWCKGNYSNLVACLSGKEFTYGGEKITLVGNPQHDPILYYFDRHIYMGWRHIRQAAIQESVTFDVSGKLEINDGTGLYQAVFGDGPIPAGMIYRQKNDTAASGYIDIDIVDPRWAEMFGEDGKPKPDNTDYAAYIKSANYAWDKWSEGGKNETIKGDEDGTTTVDPDLVEMRKAVTDAGITIYQSSVDVDSKEPGYYCYYYYWNRHNDNGLNGSMGPMEFDVVRNNVYKLSVDKITRLGHPRIPNNDPNPPTPDTDDEIDNIYLDVNVEIVPWVVRVNSIQF
ncbi:MAG: Mfa1 fimbrilin C-terminal domain-containing protein [Muribaculaceae bacterium]|nr:Mfa1 fimbrilin C-terminal domain-containing protein [Muribaculaceae bacterium]